jgi:glucose-6-phosphate isomerase
MIPADFIAFVNSANPIQCDGQDVHELFLGNFSPRPRRWPLARP